LVEGAVFKIKDGRALIVRPLKPEDKEGLVRFYTGLTPEVLHWALPPYDRARVERFFGDPEHLFGLVAESEGKIIGHLHIFRYPSRMGHLGELIIYLSQDYTNLGLGTDMMKSALTLARGRGLHRLQLSVIDGNQAAIHVYEKVGFQREGSRKDAYRGVDDRYYDAIEMGIIL
jgi:RimJ/RimL family protein N-acetyltransferase